MPAIIPRLPDSMLKKLRQGAFIAYLIKTHQFMVFQYGQQTPPTSTKSNLFGKYSRTVLPNIQDLKGRNGTRLSDLRILYGRNGMLFHRRLLISTVALFIPIYVV